MKRIVAVLVLTLCSACAGEAPGRITGEVLAGPTCPVEREGDPCEPKALEDANVIITDEDGETVTETTTGPQGRFEITIRPGTWHISARSDEAMSCDGYEAIVTAGAETEITISCDTGIR